MFDASTYAKTMKSLGLYEAACNVFHLQPCWGAAAGVPYNDVGVEHITNHVYNVPKPLDDVIIVTVPNAEYKPMEHLGAWRFVTPEEIIFGLILAIARDVDEPKSDEVLHAWRFHLLTTTMRFEILENPDDIFWKNVALREKYVTKEKAVARTPRQRIEEVALVMSRLSKKASVGAQGKKDKDVSVAQVMQAYRDKGDISPVNQDDQITETFIRAAVTLKTRALNVKEICESIKEMEKLKQHRSPWRSIYTMLEVIQRAQNPEAITWMFVMIGDRIKSGELDCEGVTKDFLSGKNGKTSAAAVFVFRLEVKHYLLKTKATDLKIREEVREMMRSKLHDFTAYRRDVKPLDRSPDLSWKKGWRTSENLWLQFVEDVVFGSCLDGPVKAAAKNHKSAAELCDYAAVKERLTQVEEARTKEDAAEQADKSGRPVAGEVITITDEDKPSMHSCP